MKQHIDIFSLLKFRIFKSEMGSRVTISYCTGGNNYSALILTGSFTRFQPEENPAPLFTSNSLYSVTGKMVFEQPADTNKCNHLTIRMYRRTVSENPFYYCLPLKEFEAPYYGPTKEYINKCVFCADVIFAVMQGMDKEGWFTSSKTVEKQMRVAGYDKP